MNGRRVSDAGATNMLLALALFITVTIVNSDIENKCLPCMNINRTCFNITYILSLQAPFRNSVVIHKIGILRSSNTLYYSFEPKLEDPEYYKVGFVNLDNPVESGVIAAGNKVMNFGTFDFDQTNEFVYLGGSDGIFILDTKQNLLAFFSSRGDRIQNLFFKDVIYFVRYGENKIVRKRGDHFHVYIENARIKNFVITKNDVTVFLSTFGLFATKRNETVQLSKNAFFRGITIDLDDVVYLWWIDGIYKVVLDKHLPKSKIVRVVQIPGIGSVLFDNNNDMLFTSDNNLYALIKTNITAC